MRTKILSALAILLIDATVTNAQITQGKYLLGGSVRYSNEQDVQYNGSPAQKFFSANIQIGKVLKENKVAGIILSYSFANNVLATYKVNEYSAGVFYREYKPLTKGLYFFGEANMAIAKLFPLILSANFFPHKAGPGIFIPKDEV